jgi:hypothetical protein
MRHGCYFAGSQNASTTKQSGSFLSFRRIDRNPRVCVLDSARKPRSPARVRRSALASRSKKPPCLLQSGADASLIAQECTGFSAPAKTRPHRGHLNSGGLHYQYVRVEVLTKHIAPSKTPSYSSARRAFLFRTWQFHGARVGENEQLAPIESKDVSRTS